MRVAGMIGCDGRDLSAMDRLGVTDTGCDGRD